MKSHPLYKQLKQIALDNNYTIEQAQNLTFTQAKTLLGDADFTYTFLQNMKRGILDTLRDRDDLKNLQDLKATAKNWLDANFPDWKAERGRESGKPYVTIWLKGKP